MDKMDIENRHDLLNPYYIENTKKNKTTKLKAWTKNGGAWILLI